jgi:subfamily B ATP-binding cassette protein MsbA
LSGLRRYWLLTIGALLLAAIGSLLEAIAFVSIVPLFGLLGAESLAGETAPIVTVMRSVYGVVDLPYTVTSALIGIAVLFLLKGTVTILSNVTIVIISSRRERDLRDQMWDGLFNARWEYVQRQNSGDIVNILMNQAANSGVALSQFLRLVVLVFTVIVYIAFAFAVSPLATLLLLTAVAVTGSLAVIVYRATSRWASRMVGVHGILYQKYNEFVAGYALVRATAIDALARRQLRRHTEEVRQYTVRTGFVSSLFGSALEPAMAIAIAGVLVLQALGGFEFSSMGAIGLLLFRSFQRVYGVTVSVGSLGQIVPSLAAVSDWNDGLASNVESHGELHVDGFQALEFKDVSFRYGDGPDVARHLDLKVSRGEFIGIVGASGSGKTTLIGLTLGLLKPTEGSVLLNGWSLDELDSQSWRARIGYVPQDTVLFTGTVYENISMWSEHIGLEDVKRAAGIAQASAFIEELPEKYDSAVGERGVNFSGGQNQRLALARAIARRPEVLLLDEATSSLDSMAEREFQDALEKARYGFTVIAIAHRLSTVMSADRVVVMDGGCVVESGPPAELLRREGGKFKEMYESQISGVVGSAER